MKKNTILLITATFLAVCFVFLAADVSGTRSNAMPADDQKMPDVVTLGKDAKLGQVTFDHTKHSGGTYTIDKTALACTTCHHTARPAADVAKTPGMKTAWPADRTTSLTAELFTKDPKAAGVVGCRECHARAGEKPKLLDAIPEFKPEGAAAVAMNNQQAFHRNCAGCHTEVKKTVPASKGPGTSQCMMCHKKAA